MDMQNSPVAVSPPLQAPSLVEALLASDSLEAHLLDCMARIVSRNEQGLDELYEATVNRVYGLALRILRNPEAAEEIVSDVYFQAWREARRYDPTRGPVQGWLLVICRSRALDALRRADPALVHPEPHELLEASAWESAGNLQDLLEATQSSSRVHEALAILSPLQRQVLSLAFFRSYTYAEVATHFAMPLGSVKTLIRGALQKMRAVVGDCR